MIVKLVLGSSVVVALRLQRGISLWLMLEVNFISFIGLLGVNKSSCKLNRALNYFLVQALGRTLILISLLFMLIKSEELYPLIFFSALLLKLGGAPLHGWYLKLIQKLSWPLVWVLSCWQKVIPLLLISLTDLAILPAARILSALVGRVGALAQTSLKKVFGLSSIFTLAWVLASMLTDRALWLYFFRGYSMTLLVVIFCLRAYFLDDSYQRQASGRKYYFLAFFIGLLIIRGIPPFLGFFLKLIILSRLILRSVGVSLVLVILRLFLIFVYLTTIFNLFTFAIASNLKSSVRAWEITLTQDLLILNSGLRVLFINFCMCEQYHISNMSL